MIAVGSVGVISVIANAFPEEFSAMTHAALKNDFKSASKIQFRFLTFDSLLYKESNPVGIKSCLEIKGICSSDVRLPLVKASTELKQSIYEEMRKEEFIN
jgi:4-hydroxy-tetrahydrodipicolinate synthase